MMVLNGQLATAIDARDRGLAYGDGVFRTLVLREGALEAWPMQWAKLANDCAALSLDCPDELSWRQAIRLAVGESRNAVVKLIVTRGNGLRGYLYPQPQHCSWLVLVGELPAYDPCWQTEGVQVRWCDLRLSSQPRLAGIKHLNRLENVLARNEWHDPEIREGLLLDQHGWVIEGTMSNLLLLSGSVLHTPALNRSGVAGVMLQRLLDSAQRLGWQVEVGDIPVDQVLMADEVGLCNSLIGVWPVRTLAQKHWAYFAGLQQLMADAKAHAEYIAV